MVDYSNNFKKSACNDDRILITQVHRITALGKHVDELENIIKNQEKRIAELEKLLNYHLKIETE